MRRDAKRVKNISGLSQILIDLKPDRCDSDVYINRKIDVTNLVTYIESKKISFVAKLSFDDSSEEVMIMIPINENDNINTISKKIKEKVSLFRNKKAKKEGANDAIDVLGHLPNIIRIPIVGLFKWCDKNGFLPSSLVKDNLYYSSMIVSNLGSINCDAIYHNIANFGTCSSLTTMGEIKNEEIIYGDGKKKIRKICEFGINFDERVADGYYFAKSVKMLEYIFDNPSTLEDNISKKIEKLQ